MRGLDFAYGEDKVLEQLDLNIGAGEKVALVGASGGGKSTLVQLLLGLYSAQRGSIRYGGVPLEEIGLDCVREHVAVVLQHPALFNDSVRANLTMGRERSDQACWRALEIAQLADGVRRLPQGLDTVVGRSGVRLSGGQRQRLAIARMILAEPKVVILDEATSALDAATEYALHQALGDFLEGRTTLIVAHRLSAVKQADRVLVFDGGHIAEDGDHQQLIAEGGLYARLYGHLQQMRGARLSPGGFSRIFHIRHPVFIGCGNKKRCLFRQVQGRFGKQPLDSYCLPGVRLLQRRGCRQARPREFCDGILSGRQVMQSGATETAPDRLAPV